MLNRSFSEFDPKTFKCQMQKLTGAEVSAPSGEG
jgi:hypothetical protein